MMAGARRYTGLSLPRKEDLRFLTGQGRYVADLSLPGMLHAAFLRSPYAHAKIVEMETTEAAEYPGVVAVFTGRDLRGRVGPIPTEMEMPEAGLRKPPYPAVAVDRVRYTGEAVAVVVAEDPYVARDALDFIDVDYEPLSVVVNQEAALEESAPQLHEEAPGNLAFTWILEGGEVDKVFKEADVVIEQRMVNQRLQPAAMETRAAVAQWDASEEKLKLWVTSQNPRTHREILSRVLKIPEEKLRVIAPDVGGGFGSKIAVYPGEAVVCYLARRLNSPVKWVESRTENFQVTIHGRDHIQYVQLAAKRDGTILALKVKSLANMGAYLSTGGPGIPTGPFGRMLSGCYRMKGVRAEVLGIFTNTTPTDAYRGAGRPEAAYAVERMVDILACKLDMDPVEIRKKNFIPKEAFPFEVCTGLTYDSGDYEASLCKALEITDYSRLRDEQAQASKEGRLLGIGLSTYVEICGIGPSGAIGGSMIRVDPSGKVLVYTGAHPHGQGEETSLAQVVADELGVHLESVEILHGDTETTPWGVGTFGSRGLAVEGGAALFASRKLLESARKVAAHLLEAREEDVVFEGGKTFVPDAPERAYTLWQLAQAVQEGSLPDDLPKALEATAFYDPENYVFPFGAHICVVQVDPETGEVQILRYIAVDDYGVVVNPLVAEGQIHGGVLQGIAQALWEGATYDEEGNLLTSSFMEYLMPTALESPRIETARSVTPSPHNPLGAKGVGEAGTIGAAPAVVNAIVDALRSYDVIHMDMPCTSERIWRIIHQE